MANTNRSKNTTQTGNQNEKKVANPIPKLLENKTKLLPAKGETNSNIKIETPPNLKNNSFQLFTQNNATYVIIIFGLILAFLIGGFFERSIRNPGNLGSSITNEIQANDTEPLNITESVNNIVSTPKTFKNAPPQLTAKSYGVFYLNEQNQYQKLFTVNEDTPLPPASLTKIMTAVIALEKYDLDKPIVIPEKCVGLNGSSVGFLPNEVYTLENLVYGLLVRSGADAACAIANIDHESNFILEMNEKAKELGMENTSFANEVGFDASDRQRSTIQDLEKLTTHALRFATFRKIVGTQEVTLQSISNPARTYRIRNTNDLLFNIPGSVGIKTGFTQAAGQCLTYLFENRGQEILVIILGSNDRFGDTERLLEWAKLELAD